MLCIGWVQFPHRARILILQTNQPYRNTDKRVIMQEMEQIVEDYGMGFITPTEVVIRMADVLAKVGAANALSLKIDECLTPLANYMCDIVNGSGQNIENFEARPKPKAVRKTTVVKKTM